MAEEDTETQYAEYRRRLALAVFVCLLLMAVPSVLSAQHFPFAPKTPSEGKAFSEFNHRLAGVFLLIIGLLAVLSQTSPKLLFLGKVWPFFFVLAGGYLAVMSDPEVWPMGPQGWGEAIGNNPEAVQHKIYAALLILIGILEFQRARGRLGKFLATWAFPALAVFGAVLLFFHKHSPSMAHGGMPATHEPSGIMHVAPGHGDHSMGDVMRKIKTEHLWFSITGFGVALFKVLHDGGFWKTSFVRFLWPACISLLGVLLLLYSE